MKLSLVERWSLANQYEILKHVDPGNASVYDDAQTALERGYEAEYQRIVGYIAKDDQVFSEHDCDEVQDILEMFDVLSRSYEDWGKPTEIRANDVQFEGFDGNNEAAHLGYAGYLEQTGRWTYLNPSVNSHRRTLPRYRAMVDAWNRSEKNRKPSVEEIQQIVAAGSAAVR